MQLAHRPALAVLALALGAVLAPAAHANLLVNGDFENEPNWGAGLSGDAGFTLLSGTQIPGWIIEAGHGATVHNTVLYPTISGNYSVNMDGEGYNGRNANLYQDFASASGQAYQLQFDWSTWNNNTQPNLDVSVVDTVTLAVLYSANFAWVGGLHHEVASFSGTGSPLRLRVQELPESGGNDNSYMVDNFDVSAVPEAATWLLMAGGLGALRLLRRRTR
jgi:hypothetical protein